MGRNTCDNLVKHSKHNSITLINRSSEKAEHLSKKYRVISKDISDLQQEIYMCDIMFVATGAQTPIVNKEEILNHFRRESKSQFQRKTFSTVSQMFSR